MTSNRSDGDSFLCELCIAIASANCMVFACCGRGISLYLPIAMVSARVFDSSTICMGYDQEETHMQNCNPT